MHKEVRIKIQDLHFETKVTPIWCTRQISTCALGLLPSRKEGWMASLLALFEKGAVDYQSTSPRLDVFWLLLSWSVDS